MRFLLLVSTASLIGGGAFGQSLLGQSQPGGGVSSPTVLIAKPPAVVASPTPPATAPTQPAATPPPGLVETPLPPPNMVQQSAAPPDLGGASQPPQSTSVQAVSPSTSPSTPPVASASAGTSVGTNAVSVSGSPALGTPASGATPPVALPPNDVPPVPENKWVYGHVVELGVLNKVDGSTTTLTIPVGGQEVSGDLTVGVQACVVRPPASLPNAAVFLTLQSTEASAADSPVYRGWIVKSLPGAAAAENSDEAFRVISCS